MVHAGQCAEFVFLFPVAVVAVAAAVVTSVYFMRIHRVSAVAVDVDVRVAGEPLSVRAPLAIIYT